SSAKRHIDFTRNSVTHELASDLEKTARSCEIDPGSADGLQRVIGHDVDLARFDNVVDDFAELGCFVRLGDDAAEAEVLITAHGCVGGVTAGNDPIHGGVDLD